MLMSYFRAFSQKWRFISTDYECPESMEFFECSTSCPNSCTNPSASQTCDLHCHDGCGCPTGIHAATWNSGESVWKHLNLKDNSAKGKHLCCVSQAWCWMTSVTPAVLQWMTVHVCTTRGFINLGNFTVMVVEPGKIQTWLVSILKTTQGIFLIMSSMKHQKCTQRFWQN